MNPLTNVRNIKKLNEQELAIGIFDHRKSWHNQYRDSAYIFIGGLPYDLTEGDILCVFSQYGEIVNINLVRDKKTGKSKGYAFIAYEDQRSTILSVDNLNSIKLGGRTIRVDHVEGYRRPKSDEKDESGKYIDKIETGCAPQLEESSQSDKEEKDTNEEKLKLKKKHKKEKKAKKKKKKKKRKHSDYSSNSESNESDAVVKRRKEEVSPFHGKESRWQDSRDTGEKRSSRDPIKRRSISPSPPPKHFRDEEKFRGHSERVAYTSSSSGHERSREHSRQYESRGSKHSQRDRKERSRGSKYH